MQNQVEQTNIKDYLTDQLLAVAPLPPEKCGQFKIQIVSNCGKTKGLTSHLNSSWKLTRLSALNN